MNDILIGIKCCHARREFADASRKTWIQNVSAEVDHRVFYGHGSHPWQNDEIQVDAPDGYLAVCIKIHEIIRWAYEYGYSFLFQVDDDTYVRPAKLKEFCQYDFVGGTSFGVDEYNRVFRYQGGVNPSGPGFWLSRKAMNHVLKYPRPGYAHPDEPWLGWLLNREGFNIKQDDRLGCYGCLPAGEHKNMDILPVEETIIAEWEYTPETMPLVHQQYESHARKHCSIEFKKAQRLI